MRIADILAPAVAAGTILAAGCSSMDKKDPETSRLLFTPREVERFAANAADPREYAVTIHAADAEHTVFVNGNRARPGLKAISSFVSPAGFALPLIEGKVGQTAAPCMVLTDSTAADSWTSMDRQRLLGLVPLGPPRITSTPVHVIDNVPGALCVLPSLTLDQLPIEAVLLFARAAHGPLWPLSRSAEAGGADVVLGWSALRSFAYVQWDFANRIVVFSATTPYEAHPTQTMASIPLEPEREGMIVKGMIDGRSQSILLDVCGDFELAMAEPPMNLVRQVALDDMVMLQVRASSIREHGLGRDDLPRVGTRLLSKYRVTLDNRRNEVVFEPPLRPGAPAAAR